MDIDSSELLPKLPKLKDLQPYPTTEFMVYQGHNGPVRCMSIDCTGRWLATGSEDGCLALWEIVTARCWKKINMGESVKDVAWNPNISLCLIAVAVGKQVLLIAPQVNDRNCLSNTDKVMNSYQSSADNTGPAENERSPVLLWTNPCDNKDCADVFRIRILHPGNVDEVIWRSQGDYFATVMKEVNTSPVYVHHLPKRKSQNPFKKMKGQVQHVLFHPTRPFFFVATMHCIRVYNLLKQELLKKLMTNCHWLSSMAIHPKGENIIVGSYDKKMSWFDMELSNKPYQTARHHKKAIRQVCFHKSYPLFASASDDGTVLVSHGKVFDDLLQNPLIVPVKVLSGHAIVHDFGVLDCEFHPTQPYIFSSGADATIRLYANI